MTGWYATDGSVEVYYEWAQSGKEAAQEYVDSGDWGVIEKTIWISVNTWQVNDDGEVVNESEHTIALDPEEPDCCEGEEHDWRSPVEIVGGIKENPGVWGHGGGVIIKEVCMNCGCGKVTDTWAQNPEDGVQGLTSVEYYETEYVEELEKYWEEE